MAEMKDVADSLNCGRRVIREWNLSGCQSGQRTAFKEVRGEHGSKDGGGGREDFRGHEETGA